MLSPLINDDPVPVKTINSEAYIQSLEMIFRIPAAFIMANTSILLGHFTQSVIVKTKENIGHKNMIEASVMR